MEVEEILKKAEKKGISRDAYQKKAAELVVWYSNAAKEMSEILNALDKGNPSRAEAERVMKLFDEDNHIYDILGKIALGGPDLTTEETMIVESLWEPSENKKS